MIHSTKSGFNLVSILVLIKHKLDLAHLINLEPATCVLNICTQTSMERDTNVNGSPYLFTQMCYCSVMSVRLYETK